MPKQKEIESKKKSVVTKEAERNRVEKEIGVEYRKIYDKQIENTVNKEV